MVHESMFITSYRPLQIRGNVMFWVVSIFLFFLGGFPCDHYPWCIGTNHTGTPPPLSLLPRCLSEPNSTAPPPRNMFRRLQLGSHCTGIPLPRRPPGMFKVPASQTDLSIMKHVRLANGRLASYWNVFLWTPVFTVNRKADIEVEYNFCQENWNENLLSF